MKTKIQMSDSVCGEDKLAFLFKEKIQTDNKNKKKNLRTKNDEK